MFDFLNRSRARLPTMRQALLQAGLSTATDPARVAVLETRGRYSGRRVTFFRAFEPGHPEVLLSAGHVEPEGVVWIDSAPTTLASNPTRQRANRADHADDERFVSVPQGD